MNTPNTNDALDAIVNEAVAAAPAAGTSTSVAPYAPTAGVPAVGGSFDPNQIAAMAMARANGVRVDGYLQVTPDGFRVGRDMQGLVDELVVDLDLDSIKWDMVVRVDNNGKVKYLKLLNADTLVDGRPLTVALRQEAQPGAKISDPYPTAQLVYKLTEAVADTKKGSTVIVPEGSLIGHSLSDSNSREFAGFYQQLQREGLTSGQIRVKLTHKDLTNKANNRWGIATFALAA